MPHPQKRLMPVEDVLRLLDETVTALSQCAVNFAAHLDSDESELPCLYQWHKLEKAARALQQAREIEHDSLAAVSVLNAEKEMIRRAAALLDCVKIAEEGRDATAPNLRNPGRKTRKHPWGRNSEDEWTAEEA
ncbi:MAG: hypothetical protein IT209_01410 [Armatimonadetes bacterium]|nr:hypothetical protein [Armatimonadota bacterium]